MTVVRAAALDDARSLAELRWEFRSGLVSAVESRTSFVDRCSTWMRRELAKGEWRAWIAIRDNETVGQVWFRTIEKVPNPVGERDRHGYLSNLYVKPAARGGVGTRLVATAIEFARANGIDRVVLWPTPRSARLYERYGFVRTGDVMELRCDRA
jgi:ribosomal protein S18 acetylase RimI-like enzyme